MEGFGAIGGLLVMIAIVVLGVLAFLMPLFVYHIHQDTRKIRLMLEAMSNQGFPVETVFRVGESGVPTKRGRV